VKGRVPFWQPKVLVKCSSFSSETFIGTKMDFKKLTFCPVEADKELRDFR